MTVIKSVVTGDNEKPYHCIFGQKQNTIHSGSKGLFKNLCIPFSKAHSNVDEF